MHKNLVKIARVVWTICSWTDRQTHTHTLTHRRAHYNTSHISSQVIAATLSCIKRRLVNFALWLINCFSYPWTFVRLILRFLCVFTFCSVLGVCRCRATAFMSSQTHRITFVCFMNYYLTLG